MQKQSELSGFLTKRTGDPNGDMEGRMKPQASNLSNYVDMSFYSAGDTLYS